MSEVIVCEEEENQKTEETLHKIIDVLNDAKLTAKHLALLYGNLGYTIGAGLEGYKEEGPSLQEAEKLYMTEPTLGRALILQGLLVSSWIDNIEEERDVKTKGETQNDT